jgi:periplasmic protein CpxP/Spy
MKKTTLSILLSASLGIAAIGHTAFSSSRFVRIHPTEQCKPKPSAEDRAKRQSEKLKQKLSLSDEQTSKVYDAILFRAKKMDEIRTKTSSDHKAVREQAKTLSQETEAKFKEIMNKEQFDTFVKWKEEKEAKMAERRKGKKSHGQHK